MTPTLSSFTFPADPLNLNLLIEHQKRYERIKAWREAQQDPYFTEVPTDWRREFSLAETRVADFVGAP